MSNTPNQISISEIQIIPVKANQGLVAFASCVVNRQFYIGNIGIHSTFNANEFRLVYPCRNLPNGKAMPSIHPIDKETGAAMQKAISAAFIDLFKLHSNVEEQPTFL